jgi:hypothetical protein
MIAELSRMVEVARRESLATVPRRVAANQNPPRAWACLTLPPNSARSLARLLGTAATPTAARSAQPSGSQAIAWAGMGQAVAGGLLFWRGRRLRGAPAAPVVAPGLRPRFFSVLPTPAKFRSR